MKEYQKSVEDVLGEYNTSRNGLTASEAGARLQKNGPNQLDQAKKVPLIVRFLQQLADPMIIILLVAAVVSLVLTLLEEGPHSIGDFADVIVITVVVLLNAILGVVQESKAEAAIEALQSMTESKCKVLRDGEMRYIESRDLVVGDIVMMEAGDSVPADCRIIESASCKAEEAALTGESVPVDKISDTITGEAALGDRRNMLYLGSSVAYGRATAVVTGTGMNTEMGKIAHVLNTAQEEKTPLQIKMAQLSKILTWVVIGISVFIFAVKLIMDGFALDTVMKSFMVAVGLAVAAIPEGLATVVTIVLSIGVTNMSKKSAIIRKMTAVETLGCAEIICSDKTGTLTQNKMTVVEHFGDDEALLARGMALCCDAKLTDGVAVGEPTECGLVNYAKTVGENKTNLETIYPRVAEAPFDSLRKMMSTLHADGGKVIQYTKGAPDEILARCTSMLVNGEIVPMDAALRTKVITANKDMADKALRVLALARVTYDTLPADVAPEAIEKDMTFIGLCGMIDPVRPEVIDAIKNAREAGIRPIMITGDHIDTAVAIAKQLGIITDSSEAVLGSRLDSMSDEEFEEKIVQYGVYARVQPEHKVRIVNTWKKLGKVCAMTGDGVNDAPSIKSADIGVGMGITGTDVTKNTADMVLADDNFATIVTAVGEGRRIYDNIRRTIQFLLSSNLAEVIAVFVATFIFKEFLGPTHLLWINLITDTFPAIALGMEAAESDIMRRAPRRKNEGIFAGGLGLSVALHGVFLTVLTLISCYVGIRLGGEEGPAQGTTMAFLTLSMAEIFHAYNARSMHGSIFHLKSHNMVLWAAMIGSLALTTIVLYVPGVKDLFNFTHISFVEYAISLGIAFLIIPMVEIQKAIVRAVHRKKRQNRKSK